MKYALLATYGCISNPQNQPQRGESRCISLQQNPPSSPSWSNEADDYSTVRWSPRIHEIILGHGVMTEATEACRAGLNLHLAVAGWDDTPESTYYKFCQEYATVLT